MSDFNQKLALITGANRGIGFALAEALLKQGAHVVLAARSMDKANEACKKLLNLGEVTPLEIEVSHLESAQKAAQFVESQFGHLDVLINNAGVFIDGGDDPFNSPDVMGASTDLISKTFETNVFGVLNVTQSFVPLLKKGNSPRVINISSGLGQLSDMGGKFTAYRLSKTSCNALTRIFAADVPEVIFNSVCPGWVKTDMGSQAAELTPAESANRILNCLRVNETGQFLRNGEVIPW